LIFLLAGTVTSSFLALLAFCSFSDASESSSSSSDSFAFALFLEPSFSVSSKLRFFPDTFSVGSDLIQSKMDTFGSISLISLISLVTSFFFFFRVF